MPVQTFEYSFLKDGPKYGNDPSIIQSEINQDRTSRAPLQNFAGYAPSVTWRPYDPTGAAGPNYFMQAINGDSYRIWDKTGTIQHTGTISDLWNPAFGGDGDPIILYDKPAGRWFMAQFAGAGNGDGLYLAVSVTGDPLGAWYTYTFLSPDFPDYEKFSVWHDGYYMTANYDEKIFAFNRTKMLAGDASAEAVYQTFAPAQNGGFFVPMPADASDGVLPTSGPCPIFTNQDNAWGSAATDAVNIFNASVTWGGTPNMDVTSDFSLNTSAMDLSYNASWNDVEQPGGAMLDGIGGALGFRVQWKQFPCYNTAVMCWPVQVSAAQRGIFWCELRQNKLTDDWTIYQQGIYAPGTDNVWLGSIAMNDAGDIALSYAKTNASGGVYMSLAYTGRLSCDPLGTLPIPEVIAQSGSSAQTGINRVGDYAQTTLDPDGVTFWYTGEYMGTGGNAKTRIYSYQLPGSCAAPTITTVSHTSLFEDRGKQITIQGTNLIGCCFDIGGISGSEVSNDGNTAVVTFPPADYPNPTALLTAAKASGSASYNTIDIENRNLIPVISGSSATSDNHPTILSATYGLHAWFGTNAFNAGDRSGTKTINVEAGTYTDEVILNSELNPVAGNILIIQNNSGDQVVVDASGNDYGFDLNTVDYVTLSGFAVHSADIDNIYLQGDNNEIQFNKAYSAGSAGIKVETGVSNNIHNNLVYGNTKYGIHIASSNNNNIENNTTDDNGGNFSPAEVTVLDEKFESGMPTGWNEYGPGLNSWTVGFFNDASSNPILGPDGSTNYVYHMWNATTINKSLETVSFDLTSYASASLTYYVYHSGTWGDIIYTEVSTDGGGSGGTWDELEMHDQNHSGWSTLQTVNLTPYVGNTIHLRFRYSQTDGNVGGVDVVKIKATQTLVPTGAGLYVESGTGTTVENNIFVSKNGAGYYALNTETGVTVSSDFNTYFKNGNTNVVQYAGVDHTDLADWTANTIQNTPGTGDIEGDPKFVSGTDYHIRSTIGSYNGGEWPPLTANTTAFWTAHATDDSPALDTGNPTDGYANEPQDGGFINQGCYGNTVQASKSGTTVLISWNGSTGSDWQTTSNWTPPQIPTNLDDVTIPNGMLNYPIVDDAIGNIAVCKDITIENASSVTINPDGYMTVSGTITNNAGNAGLVINSNATGTGSLIQGSASGVDATVNSYLSAGVRQWHMVGSPIASAPVSTFPTTNNLYSYDESVDDYWTSVAAGFESAQNGWTIFNSGSMQLNTGYLFNYFPTTLNYTGELNPNTTTNSIIMNYTTHTDPTPAPNAGVYADYDGWNLLANPYTSAVQWDWAGATAAYTTADIDAAVYVYDGASGLYLSWVSSAGTLSDGTIPTGQAFFVKAKSNGGDLSIPASALKHDSHRVWRNENSTPENFMSLRIAELGSTAERTDETIIRFNENATLEHDSKFDAYKLFSHEDNVFQIYTKTNSETQYSINTFQDIESIVIPISLVNVPDNFTITADKFNFPNTNVYLRERSGANVNQSTEISEGGQYSFSNTGNSSEERFELVFEKHLTSVASIDYYFNIFPNPTDGNIYITASNIKGNYDVEITNIAGQIVYKGGFNSNHTQLIDLSAISQGLYFLSVKTNNKVIFKEKVIKH